MNSGQNSKSACEQWDSEIREALNRLLPHVKAIQQIIYTGCVNPGDVDEDEINDILSCVHLVAMKYNKHITSADYAIGIEKIADGVYDIYENTGERDED